MNNGIPRRDYNQLNDIGLRLAPEKSYLIFLGSTLARRPLRGIGVEITCIYAQDYSITCEREWNRHHMVYRLNHNLEENYLLYTPPRLQSLGWRRQGRAVLLMRSLLQSPVLYGYNYTNLSRIGKTRSKFSAAMPYAPSRKFQTSRKQHAFTRNQDLIVHCELCESTVSCT